jgi:hypothetical protein
LLNKYIICNVWRLAVLYDIYIYIYIYVIRQLKVNRTQTVAVIGLLTGHNALRRHLLVMELSNDPACRKSGTEKETSVYILCECKALASLRHKYLGSFFLDPEDIRVLGVGAIWSFIKGTGLL